MVLVNEVQWNLLGLLPGPMALRHFPSGSTETPITKQGRLGAFRGLR